MTKTISIEEVERRYDEGVQARRGAVLALGQKQRAVDDLAAQCDLAIAERDQAWAAAVDAGEPEHELRRLGLTPPTRKPPGRPRGTGTRRAARATPAPVVAETPMPDSLNGGEQTPAEAERSW